MRTKRVACRRGAHQAGRVERVFATSSLALACVRAAHPDRAALSSQHMLSKLPGWVVDDDTSIREEVAEWRGLTPAELWRLARLCARDAVWAARVGGNTQRILEQVDPLPADTVIALARLRRASGWHRDDR